MAFSSSHRLICVRFFASCSSHRIFMAASTANQWLGGALFHRGSFARSPTFAPQGICCPWLRAIHEEFPVARSLAAFPQVWRTGFLTQCLLRLAAYAPAPLLLR